MARICATIARLWRSIVNNVMRKFPSKYHASKWPMVERVLCMRSMALALFLLAAGAPDYYAKDT